MNKIGESEKVMNTKDVLEKIEKEGIRWIDVQFLDVPGYLQHVTIEACATNNIFPPKTE